MNGAFRMSRSTRALIAANVLLAAIVTAELLYSPQSSATTQEAGSAGEAKLPAFTDARLTPPPVSQFVDMLERPLFYIDRRMPEPPAEAAQAPPTPLRLKLEGIAIAGGSRVAVLRNLNGNGLIQLAEGESHEGWTLDALSSNSASFSRDGDQSTELPLEPVGNGRRR